MTPIEEHMVTSAFLLGKLQTGLYCILNMTNTNPGHKLEKLAELEKEIRTATEKLYYPNQPDDTLTR